MDCAFELLAFFFFISGGHFVNDYPLSQKNLLLNSFWLSVRWLRGSAFSSRTFPRGKKKKEIKMYERGSCHSLR